MSKTTVPPEVICRFSAISVKLPMAFFIELEPKNLKICMETQKTLSSQSNLEKEKQSWRNRWYKGTITKPVLAQKEIQIMVQDRKPAHLCSVDLLWPERQDWRKTVSSLSSVWAMGQLH